MGHVLVSPLDWGLGHASRDVPVIRELMRRGHEVTVAASGNALTLLRREFPACHFIHFPDYPLAYNQGRFFFPTFISHMPALIRALSLERETLAGILSDGRYDMIISDSRPGVYSKKIPSFQITHQTHQSFPLIVWPIELIALYVNARGFAKYTGLIIPDNPPGERSLAGKLSGTFFSGTKKHSYYCGILASIEKAPVKKTIDWLVLISGMEPQRTRLEQLLLPQVPDLPGEKIVILGKPSEDRVTELSDGTRCFSYVSYHDKARYMSGAKSVLCRSGYTTMMDLAELGIRKGLFIPTPGQWEQEYLSRYYMGMGWFLSKSQYRLKLGRAVEQVSGYTGFPDMPKTDENVKKLYEELLAAYLE